VLAGLAAIVLIYALVSALERRELVWPSAIVGLGLSYLYVRHTQSPYVAAKALMVPAPLLVAGSGGALMRRLEITRRWGYSALAFAVVTAAFFVFAFQSSWLVLDNAFVGPHEHVAELRTLRSVLGGRPTLVLFYDDFFQWELLGQHVSSPVVAANVPGAVEVPLRSTKPWSFGQDLDFDSVDASTLDRFDFVITTRTAAQSQPPPNFHLAAVSRSYEVFRRLGPTPEHQVLPESGSYGAVLNCRAPAARQISHERGMALVRRSPVEAGVAALAAGGSEQVVFRLPAGRWDLSLPFTSPQAVRVTGGGLDVRLVPNLDRVGEVWPVGTVTSDGQPITLRLKMSDPGLISGRNQYFVPRSMIAVSPGPGKLVPLRSACGRFVDWYTTASHR
jgi:hypothetical protein